MSSKREMGKVLVVYSIKHSEAKVFKDLKSANKYYGVNLSGYSDLLSTITSERDYFIDYDINYIPKDEKPYNLPVFVYDYIDEVTVVTEDLAFLSKILDMSIKSVMSLLITAKTIIINGFLIKRNTRFYNVAELNVEPNIEHMNFDSLSLKLLFNKRYDSFIEKYNSTEQDKNMGKDTKINYKH